jgi:hypothetical protein
MRSNERLQRVLAIRHLGGTKSAAIGFAASPSSSPADDLRLFALTFVGGFLFTTIFIG